MNSFDDCCAKEFNLWTMVFAFNVVTLCLCLQILWYPTNLNSFMTYKIHEVLKSSSNHTKISKAHGPWDLKLKTYNKTKFGRAFYPKTYRTKIFIQKLVPFSPFSHKHFWHWTNLIHLPMDPLMMWLLKEVNKFFYNVMNNTTAWNVL